MHLELVVGNWVTEMVGWCSRMKGFGDTKGSRDDAAGNCGG